MRPDETLRYDRVRRIYMERLRSLQSEYVRRERIRIVKKQAIRKPCCLAYFDINGFVAKSNLLSELWEVNQVEARRILRRRVGDAMDRLLLDYHVAARRAIGGDAWLNVFEDVDSAILWARNILEEVRRESVGATIAMDWGVPLLISSGALDTATITAIKVAEKYGDRRSQILLTEEAKLHITDHYWVDLCQSIETFVSETLGKISISQIKYKTDFTSSSFMNPRIQTRFRSRPLLFPSFQDRFTIEPSSSNLSFVP
jgi:hypothetical protein